ncbi:MAG: ABC transporter permease [Candidatus Nanopelagicales bacterium]
MSHYATTTIAAAPPATAGNWAKGVRDLADGAHRWRLSYLLGISEIRRRYARSRLGQLWVTATMALMIGALGFVWSQLWKQPVAAMMPFVAVSMVAWTYMSGVLSDAPTTFISAAPIMHNQGIEFSAIVYGLLLKHLFVLAHNLPIVVVVMALFAFAPGFSAFGALLGLTLLTIFLFGLSYLIAIVCLRFRDLAQIVQNIVMVLFFITPVLWKPEQISADHAYLLKANPFAIYLATIQKPLLGDWPTESEWAIAAGLAAAVVLLVIPLVGWARNRLIYWV